MKPGPPQVVELGDQLLGLLDSRLAAVDHDDVAKLALKRTAPRILECRRGIPTDLEQVEPRTRHLRHIGGLSLFVAPRGLLVVRELIEKSRPGGLRLAHEADIAQPLEKLLLHRHQRAAHCGEHLQFAESQQDLPHAFFLHDHAGHADDVVPRNRLPVDFLHVFIDECHVVVAAQAGESRERARDHRAPFVAWIQWEREIEAPIGRLKAGVDQAD